mmetsp:Transcript_134852/g.247796  ORF Transcript_134852/g.247796 Transcript_134852/m.247796 type:complete len:210 (+) Transcript_134852:88-717(+)
MYGALRPTEEGEPILLTAKAEPEDLADALAMPAAGDLETLAGLLVPAEPSERWDKSAVAAAALQLFLWAGSWGLVDAAVQRVAPDRPDQRFFCYAIIVAIGSFSANVLLKTQSVLSKRRRHPEAARLLAVPGVTDKTSSLVLSFAVAVQLCAGLWGMIDSTVEALAGDSNSYQLLWYFALTAFAAAGVAVHHRFWPHQVLDGIGQLTLV